MSKIFAGPLGSFLKAFITALLTLFVAKYNEGVLCLDTACLKDVVLAALFATLPVIINYLNPNYQGYGVKNN